MIYSCCDSLRRADLAASGLNGIDFLEVLDRDAVDPDQRQKRLFVHFIKDLSVSPLTAANVRIEGGERIRGIVVTGATAGSGADANVLTVDVSEPGDHSIYTLRLVTDALHRAPPDSIDPMLAAVDFSFKVECASDFDCQPTCECPPEQQQAPEIDYLAKDYASFRRLMLDRMSFLMPQWQERHVPDLGVALVEVLAYVGDYLSYQQDAVATEAYLGTARRRVSVRRHAKLVDYAMHEGCNARVWVQLQVQQDVPLLSAGSLLCSRIDSQPAVVATTSDALGQALEFFETVQNVALFQAHDEMHFYTWSGQRCCLPQGATAATMLDNLPNLKIGDVVIFEEVIGAETGNAADADLQRRCAVRLTDVETAVPSIDGPPRPLVDPVTGVGITQIRWADEDALPFPVCVSGRFADGDGGVVFREVSVARGNIVLADHGRTLAAEDLGVVPAAVTRRLTSVACDPCGAPNFAQVPPRYRPRLVQQPLTFAVPSVPLTLFGVDVSPADAGELDLHRVPSVLAKAFDAAGISLPDAPEVQGTKPIWSIGDGRLGFLVEQDAARLSIYQVPPAASAMLEQDVQQALPVVQLTDGSGSDATRWNPRRDLLESKPADRDFVVETESDGVAWLRFGDDELGSRPKPGDHFFARYRVGGGVAGNVGAESIAHLVSDDPALRGAVSLVRNPLPAAGGTEPESLDQVRAYAPAAFRTQERAVTEDDYASVAERHPQVQKAQATFRWTGSWHTVFITIDRLGGLAVDDAFKQEVRNFVERFRMAGHDLEVDGPRFVSLDIEMHVCAKPGYLREDVRRALLSVFNDRRQPDGRLGLFHPDNFTFGQPVYLSPLVAAAQVVDGVQSVRVQKFQRQGTPDTQPLAAGRLDIHRLEIARCANDPDFAERGIFKLTLGGGL